VMENFEYEESRKRYISKGELKDSYVIQIEYDNEVSANRLIFKYNFNYERRKFLDNFSLVLGEVKKDIQRNADELISQAQKGPVEFNLLRKFLIDARGLIDEWDGLKEYSLVYYESLLLFLEVTPVAIPAFKNIYNDLAESWYNKSEKSNNIEPIQRLDAIARYLDVCFNNKSQQWFDDREIYRGDSVKTAVGELLSIKLDNQKDSNNKQFDRKKEKLLQQSKSWLLSRYDLRAASRIEFRDRKLPQYIFLFLPEFLATLTLVMLWFLKEPAQVFGRSMALGPLYLALAICGVLLMWNIGRSGRVQVKTYGGFNKNMQLLLPRVAAGIMVGYFFLLSDEAWRSMLDKAISFSVLDDPWLASGRMLLPLFGVLVYIFIEMNNVTGIVVGLKPLQIFCRAYSYSILIGVIFSDIFGRVMVKNNTEQAIHGLKGFFGIIYPEVIFYQAPLALFIGIFLQLLWEDKTLTEKI